MEKKQAPITLMKQRKNMERQGEGKQPLRKLRTLEKTLMVKNNTKLLQRTVVQGACTKLNTTHGQDTTFLYSVAVNLNDCVKTTAKSIVMQLSKFKSFHYSNPFTSQNYN